MGKKIAIRNVEAGMRFKVTTPTELNLYGIFKENKYNSVKNRALEEGEILTIEKTIENNQVAFKTENGDGFIAFWSVFKDETLPDFDTTKVLNKNTVGFYLKDNNLEKIDFEVVKKEFATHRSNSNYVYEYPIIIGVRYEYGMESNFNLDVIKAYKTEENIEEYKSIVINKLKNNWVDIQPLIKNEKDNTKIKIFTRRKKVIMEIAELPCEFKKAVAEIEYFIDKYKNDSKTHMALK